MRDWQVDCWALEGFKSIYASDWQVINHCEGNFPGCQSRSHSGSHIHTTWAGTEAPSELQTQSHIVRLFSFPAQPKVSHSRASDISIFKIISSWCNNITPWAQAGCLQRGTLNKASHGFYTLTVQAHKSLGSSASVICLSVQSVPSLLSPRAQPAAAHWAICMECIPQHHTAQNYSTKSLLHALPKQTSSYPG